MKYRVKGGAAEAYRSDPDVRRPAGQVIVIHEVWGFTRFIQDVCTRLARQGFCAMAPVLYWRDKDIFSPETIREGLRAVWGLSLEERHRRATLEAAIKRGQASSKAASMLRTLYDMRFRNQLVQDLQSLSGDLRKERPDIRMGTIGFSMGGKLALQLAGGCPELAACVTYSAEPVVGPALKSIRSPMLLLYGSQDRFMLRHLPVFVKEAVGLGKELELKVYASAGHEFFDHTKRNDFHARAAQDAWEATEGFLRKNLSVGTERKKPRARLKEEAKKSGGGPSAARGA